MRHCRRADGWPRSLAARVDFPEERGIVSQILLRPAFDQQSWPLITFVAALAVSDVLLQCCNLKTDIKWPNDLLVKDRKLCGILAETIETSAGRAVIVGTGINVRKNSFPVELESIATSVETETGRAVAPVELLEPLLGAFSKHYQTLQQAGGNESIVRAVSARSSYASNKRVRVNVDGRLVGTTRGLESDGSLRVETDDGKVKVVRAGDVSSIKPG